MPIGIGNYERFFNGKMSLNEKHRATVTGLLPLCHEVQSFIHPRWSKERKITKLNNYI